MKKQNKSEYVPALGFHWLTPYYDIVIRATSREHTFKMALIEQSSLEKNHQVLDLASGTGTLSIWLKKSQPLATIIGVDADPAIVSIAAAKAQKANVSIQFDRALSYDLPYPEAYFDRIVSSLFFHHLSWEDKERTVKELYRVIKPGAELHVADWGQAGNLLMRGLFLIVQIVDGFENTRDNVSGKLITLFESAGFIEVTQRKTFSTIYGTLSLYSAVKPA